MRNYEVTIDVGDLLHYSDILKPQINNETLLALIRSFSVYVRDLYMNMIQESMHSVRYRGNWEPVEEDSYVEYLGVEPTIPIAEIIYESLEIREIKENIVIRFDPRYKYPGSQRTVLSVVRAIDNGTLDFNARPIFRVIISRLNHMILQLWKMYLKNGGVA